MKVENHWSKPSTPQKFELNCVFFHGDKWRLLNCASWPARWPSSLSDCISSSLLILLHPHQLPLDVSASDRLCHIIQSILSVWQRAVLKPDNGTRCVYVCTCVCTCVCGVEVIREAESRGRSCFRFAELMFLEVHSSWLKLKYSRKQYWIWSKHPEFGL